jgi:hypothetical protein
MKRPNASHDESAPDNTTWKTSVFPDRKAGCYLLAIKAGDTVAAGVTIE